MTMTATKRPVPAAEEPTPDWIASNNVMPKNMHRRMVEQVDLLRREALRLAGETSIESFVPEPTGSDASDLKAFIAHFNPKNRPSNHKPGHVTHDATSGGIATSNGIKLELVDDVYIKITPKYTRGDVQFEVIVQGPRSKKAFVQSILAQVTAKDVQLRQM